jgi:23S rRNA (uracil-5-)-methyltransferase RumA
MKKGQIAEGKVTAVEFPNKGIVMTDEGERVIVKNTIAGQKVSFAVNKARRGKYEARLLEVLEKSPLETISPCPHFGSCGGCVYQSLPYEEQLKLKSEQVKSLMEAAIGDSYTWEFQGIKESPRKQAYRNKMEFSFGDEYREGPLALGMHKRGSFYDIVTVKDCQIVDGDFRAILSATLSFFAERGVGYYHRIRHTGYLRHLLVRKAVKTGEILIDLITTTQDTGAGDEEALLSSWKEVLLSISLEGSISGILHTKNDSVADVVKNEGTDILYGVDYFYEELLGLRFKISPFSFFQTNSLGAEVLYKTARSFLTGDDASALGGKIVYDLYSGTGTIAQMLAPVAKKVIGVEIVEEAVEAARENALENGLTNCEFLAGDVLKVLDTIEERPDYIVLDPPRDGIHPKALERIISYGVDRMIYISCKPTSLARDLEVLIARGYRVEKICCTDLFPSTYHCETVVKLVNIGAKPDFTVSLEVDVDDFYKTVGEEKRHFTKNN